MWWKKLRQKKQQFLLIGIILTVTTAILCGCISFTIETNIRSESFFKPENCPDLFYLMSGKNMERSILDNSSMKEDVGRVFSQPAKIIKNNLLKNGTSLPSHSTSIIALENYKELPWYMGIAKGDKNLLKPGDREIWISSIYAKDNDIQVGDILNIAGNESNKLKVSALFNSALCPSAMMGVFPMYCNQATLETFNEKDATYLSISLKKGLSDRESFAGKLPAEFFQNVFYDFSRSDMKLSFTIMATLFGAIGMLSALVIFIVFVLLIRFILKSNLMREYRSIGIYKALGFTCQEIKEFYLKCYLLVSLLALPLGVLLGIPVSQLLGNINFRYLGTYRISSATPLLCIAAVLVLLLIIVANIAGTLRNINKISPVDAFNIAMTSSKAKLKKSLIKNAHSPLSMAVNQIFKRKGISLMITLILMVSFYLTLLFSSINITCVSLDNHLDKWFGIPSNDCSINSEISEDLKDYLKHSPYVKDVIYSDYHFRVQNLKCNDKDVDFSDTSVFPYSSFQVKGLNFHYINGRPPENLNEIGLSSRQRKAFGVKVGDYVNLTMGDYTGEYLVCGEFSTLFRGGNTIHILNSEADKCNLAYTENFAFIKLKDKSSFSVLKKDLETNFPNAQLEKINISLKNAADTVKDLAAPITIVFVVVFFLFSLLNIINLLLMNNIENRRQFGILKALGFTNGYIFLQNILRILLLSCVAILLAQVLHGIISRPIFMITGGIDAMESPLGVNIKITLGTLGALLLTAVLLTLPLRKIVATELMEE
jgi:Predicted ABC-type transport system involved in lysophospholipase L1 biosynthesis, permease component